MTNREFLDSLSNEQFANWMFDKLEIKQNDPDSILGESVSYEGFQYTTMSYINPYFGFLRWLYEERKGGGDIVR